jgi:uncharacterized RDD family membrane protein YckC
VKANTQPVPEVALNPYAAPAESQGGDVVPALVAKLELAPRGSRLVATIIDALLFGAALTLGYLFSLALLSSLDQATLSSRWASLAMSFGLLLYAYQSYAIASTGQSIGKRMCRVRIVRQNGEPAGFLRAVLLRMWLFSALGFIPVIKYLALIDALLIFQVERRCLHDRVAGTIVIAV